MKIKKDSATLQFLSITVIVTIGAVELYRHRCGEFPTATNVLFGAAVVGLVTNLLILISRYR